MLDFCNDYNPEFRFVNDCSVEVVDVMGNDLSIINAAKVSFGKRSEYLENGDMKPQDIGLLKFLARGMDRDDFRHICQLVEAGDLDIEQALEDFRSTPIHKSPFNHAFVTFRIKAPIFVARQLVKHEYLVWNEISGRYIEFEPCFFLPHEFRKAAENVKQGSRGIVANQGEARHPYTKSCENSYEYYKQLIDLGLCKEQARAVLPQCTMTEWVWSGSLHAFQKMCMTRTRADTQGETAVLAEQIQMELYGLFPNAMEALDTHGIIY